MTIAERGRNALKCTLMAAIVSSGSLAYAEAAGKSAAPKSTAGFAVPKEQPVQAELITEHASIQPGGETKVGVYFEIEEGWHIYYKDPGDAGLPTKVTWKAPPAVSFGPLTWPKAQQFLDPGNIKTFGYTDAVILYSPISFTPLVDLDRTHKEPDLLLRADVEWLACKEICVPGSATLTLSLPVRSAPAALSPHAQLFAQTN